jgi:TRAP-type uncharacterized transport system substrate-binding protein
MKKILLTGVAALLAIGSATGSVSAQNVTLTSAAASPGGATDIAAKFFAEVAAANKIATIQVQVGQVLTKTMVQVAEGKTDMSAAFFLGNFLMSRSLGPFSGLGKKRGKELAGNMRLLVPFHLAHFVLVAYQTTGIDSYAKLKGKIVHNGPPRGGAYITAKAVIRLSSGLDEGKGYTGKQIAWGQANSIFLDRSVDAAVRPATNPASWMPIYMSAGKINMVSVPKKAFEGKSWVKYYSAPGNVPVVFPVKDLAHYGANVRVISDDNMFRSVANAGGTMVNKKMDKKLAKSLTAAFIKNLPDLYRKTAFAKTSYFGSIETKNFNFCKAGIKFHPGAQEAWQEAGHKVPECTKP